MEPSSFVTAPKRIIIDTDVGVDDAMAILLALLSPKECKIEAITTVSGNVHVNQATENILRIFEVYHKAVAIKGKKPADFGHHPLPPVYMGEAQPLRKKLEIATHVHGNDGLGNSSLLKNDKGELTYPYPQLVHVKDKSAPQAILDILDANPGEITIITLGPMTNIARAAQMDMAKMKKAKEIVVMGGAFEHYGNVSLSAEFNIWVDPDSVDVALTIGVPMIFVPLDVTEQVWFDLSLAKPYVPSSILSQFILDITTAICVFKTSQLGRPVQGLHMHDPLAVSIVLNPEIIPNNFRKDAMIFVECEGKYTNGKTLADLRKAKTKDQPPSLGQAVNGTVCVGVHPERFLKLFEERVLQF